MLRSSSVCDTNCTCGIIKLLHASQCLKYGGIYNIISLPKWVVIAVGTQTRSDRKYRYRKEHAARSFMRQRNHSNCVRQCARLRSASRRSNTALCVGNLYMPTSQINSDVDCDHDVEKLCIAHQISSVHIFWCDMHI